MEDNSESQSISTRSAGIRYGLILGVVSIVYFLLLTILSVDMTGPIKYVSYLMAAAFIFLAHKYFKDNGDGFMGYGQGIGIAFWMSIISSVISSVFTFIYIKFVDSGFIDALKEKQLEQFQEKGMTDQQIDQAMSFSDMFMTPGAILIFGLVGGILGTVIIALIVTIFTQKKAPEQTF